MSQIPTPQPPPGFVPMSSLVNGTPQPAAVPAPAPAPVVNAPLPGDSASPQELENYTPPPQDYSPPKATQGDGTPTPPPGFVPVSKLSQQQTASPQDEAGLQQYIADRYRETFGHNVVTSLPGLHPQVQGFMQRTHGINPDSPDGLWPVVDSSAAEFVRAHEAPDAKAQREGRFAQEYAVIQRVKQRDAMATKALLEAQQLNPVPPHSLDGDQFTPEQAKGIVDAYAKRTPGGNLINDPNLPPFKYSSVSGNPHVETDLTGTGVLHGLVNRSIAATAGMASSIPEAVGRGVNSAEAQAFQHFNTPTGNNPYADRLAKYNQGVEELHGAMDSALPGSDFAKQHPGYGMVEEGAAQVPGMVGLGALGKAGTVGHVATYATIAAGEYNSGYQTTYKALTAQGVKPIDADAKAQGAGAVDAAINTYLMKHGALGEGAGQAATAAIKDRLKAVAYQSVIGGAKQGGVGAGQDIVKQLTQYAATGNGPDAEKFLDETLQNAVTGAIATPFMHGQTVKQGEQAPAQAPPPVAVGEKPAPGAIDNINNALTPPPAPPPDQAGPPKTLKQARQRNKGQMQLQPPADMQQQAPVPVPAQADAQAPAAAPPPPAPETPAQPVAKPTLPEGDLTADTPERRAWLIDAMQKVPDPSKWADAVEKGKLKPWPDAGPAQPTKEAPRANPQDAQGVSGGEPSGQGAEQAPAQPDRSQAPGPVREQAAAPAAETPDRPSAGTPPADGERGRPAGSAGEDKPAAKVKRAVDAARTIVPDLKPVDPKTADQREASQVAKDLGMQPVFYQSNTKGRAFVHPDHPDVLFIHTKNRAAGAVREAVGHELAHNLSLTDPESLARIVDSIDPSDLSDGAGRYLENYRQTHKQELDPAREPEEGIAQVLGEAATKDQVWRAMQGKDPTAFQKLGDAMQNITSRVSGGPRMDKIAEAWKAVREKRTTPAATENSLNLAGKANAKNEAAGDEAAAPGAGAAGAAGDGTRRGGTVQDSQRVDRSAADAQGADLHTPADQRGRVEVPTTIETPQGAVKARYKLVEADSLIPSHHEFNFRPNEKHVGGQERQYDTDRAEREKVVNNDRKFDSRHVLSDDPTPANGPPMAARDGSVIGGNSRAMVIKRVYTGDDARSDQLRQDTLDAAQRMGIAGGDALNKPVLVRELDEPVTKDNAAQLSRQLQKGLTQDMTAEADAASRGKLLLKNEKTLPALESILGDGGTVRDAMSRPSSAKRIIGLLNDSGAMTPQETSKFLEPDGSFTEDGKKMVERVLTSSVVSDPNLLKDLPANVAAKITSNLADLAYTKTKGDGWDLTEPLTKALTSYMKMRGAEGVDAKALGRYAEQSQLVKDPGLDDPRARPILESLVKENTQQFKQRVKAYAEDARSLDPGQSRMFGTADVTPEQAFKDAFAETTPRGVDKGLFLAGGPVAKAAGDKLAAAAKDVAEGIRDTHQDILDTLAPQAKGDKAAFTGRRVREYGGDLERRRVQAQHALQDMRDYFAGRPKSEVDDFIHRVETGRAQPSKDLADMAKLVRDMMDSRLAEVQALGTGKLTSFIKNYFPHFWKDTAKAEAFYGRRPLEGGKDFLKKRIYQLRSDGLSAGLEPLYENPVDDVLARAHAMDKYILAQRMLAELKANGIAKLVRARDKTPAGFADIEDKIATVYGKPNRKGAVLIKGRWVADEGAARAINNYLGPGLREGRFGYIVKRAMGLNSLMNAADLALSVRHAFVDSAFAMSGQIGTGLQRITEGAAGLDPKTVWAGAKDVATSPLAPFIDAVRGSKLLRAYADSNGGHGVYDTLAQAYAKSGGRGQRLPEYENGLSNRLAETFRKIGLPEWMASPIMRGLVPRLKAGGFVRDALYEMQKAGPGMTKDELTKIGGRLVDNMDHRLGEMIYDNTLWDRRAKDLLMLTTRSVGWNAGTLLAAKGALADVWHAARDVTKGKMPTIGNRLGFAIGMTATHAMVGALIHHLLTGKEPEELKDYFYPKTGELDAQGHDIRLSIPTYINDGRGFYQHTRQTLLNKSAPLINALGEMYQNKDYYGVRVVDKNDSGLKQAGEYLKFFAKQFTPFSAREIGVLADDKVPLKDKLMPLAGINTAPKELSRSKAENLAIQLAGDEHGEPAPKSPEQADRYKLVRQLGDAVRLKQPGAKQAVQDAYKAGKITKADVPTLKQIAQQPYVARLIAHLTPDDTLKVWKAATPDERKELLPHFVQKLRDTKSISPIRAREILREAQATK